MNLVLKWSLLVATVAHISESFYGRVVLRRVQDSRHGTDKRSAGDVHLSVPHVRASDPEDHVFSDVGCMVADALQVTRD